VRIAVGALIIAGLLLALVSVHPVFLLWLGLPMVLAVALVIARKFSPPKATLVGALVTLGIILLVVLPGIVVKWLSGDWASGEYCDGFCMTNTEGFIFALFILTMVAVPAAIAGGIISAIASFVGVRPANSG
jgi:hypothetical protein